MSQVSSNRIDAESIATLRGQIRGAVLGTDDANYDGVRSIWNAMIDRRPAVIVRAAGAADVIQTVNFAKAHNAQLAIRGGGHNIAGNAVCEGGVMLDLSNMKSVRIDPVARTARVEPGVTLSDFDREAQAFGLTTPTGINSTTGIAGLTLGGGSDGLSMWDSGSAGSLKYWPGECAARWATFRSSTTNCATGGKIFWLAARYRQSSIMAGAPAQMHQIASPNAP